MNKQDQSQKGLIAWMINNRVTSNLLMIVLLVGGFITANQIKQEVYPEFTLDMVSVSVPYSGASPEEIEKGIILAIEEAIQGVDGIKEYTSTASEGSGVVTIELQTGVNQQTVLQDIKQEVDSISTFPDDAEDPIVSLVSRKREVLQINLFGNTTEQTLRELAETTRDRLLQQKGISQVEIVGGKDFEVAVEINQQQLRTYGLTLGQVATIIEKTSLEIPGGKIKASGGEILLRVKNRHDWAEEFARIPIITNATGGIVYLEDIATVSETFEDSDKISIYNGSPSIALDVQRIGDETPIGVADATREAMASIEADYPSGVEWAISRDNSIVYKQRLQLLLKNACMGLLLVLVLLGTFLEFRLACWVTLGIPVSFIGGLMFLPMQDISINMISMFAFIIALGIVVDDAIIAGENIYEYKQMGFNNVQAAIKGTQDVAMPIAFAVLTNIVAFMPMFFIPGAIGKVWCVIPGVVITVFTISWIESTLILPSHLAHSKAREPHGFLKLLRNHQLFFSGLLRNFIKYVYTPTLDLCLRKRVTSVAIGLAIFILAMGYMLGGRIDLILMPRIESDRAVATAVLPYGTPLARVQEVRLSLESALERVKKANGRNQLVEGVYTRINENEIEVNAFLTDPEVRGVTTKQVTEKWRKEVGSILGLQSLLFESDRGGPGSGAALSVELSHRDINILDQASSELAEKIDAFASTSDVNDGFVPGKEQLDFQLTAAGESLGLTTSDIAQQIRNSFQGASALKQQRGRNEMTVRVRLPENERLSEFNIETMMIHTPHATFVPLSQVATVKRSRAYTTIDRREGRRVVTVTANVEPIGKVSQIEESLRATTLVELTKKYPGLTFDFRGRQADRNESMSSLILGFAFSMMAIYALLAIPFRSYIQPIIVMFSIPFGIVGALIGHILMGYDLSVMSMMGIVALSGVIVNDSLVLVDYANKKIIQGLPPLEAIRSAGIRRFRPIMLTTLTTFGGLAPMIFETSRQARFMIPMAISLGFGILFTTFIALLLVPCFFLLIDDINNGFKRFMSKEVKTA